MESVERVSRGVGQKITADRIGMIGRADSFEEVGRSGVGGGNEVAQMKWGGGKGNGRGGGMMVIPSREGICCCVGSSGSVIDLKIELLEELRPANLARGEMRLSCEVSKRLMVCDHMKFASMQIMPPLFQCYDYCQQLLFMHWIFPLMLIHLVGKECYRLQSFSLILTQRCSNCKSGCIGSDYIRKRFIRDNEYGC